MVTENRRAVLLLIAFAAVALAVSKCQESRWRANAAIHEADSLRIESRRDSLAAATFRDSATVARAERDEALQAAERAQRTADILRADRARIQPVASQPGAAPSVSDTLVAVDSSLTLCEEETTVLRAAIDADRTALAAAEREVVNVTAALTIETSAASHLRQSNADLTRLLAQAEPPCRIAFWGCPSRTQAAIVGVLVGAGVTYSVVRR